MKIYLSEEVNGGGIQEIIGCYTTKELAQEAIQNTVKESSYLKVENFIIEVFDLDLKGESND
jgi:hypothetical protein